MCSFSLADQRLLVSVYGEIKYLIWECPNWRKVTWFRGRRGCRTKKTPIGRVGVLKYRTCWVKFKMRLVGWRCSCAEGESTYQAHTKPIINQIQQSMPGIPSTVEEEEEEDKKRRRRKRRIRNLSVSATHWVWSQCRVMEIYLKNQNQGND